MQWREWSGFFAASAYHDCHVIEYNAIREAAALIDVSPLFKYELRGPDALRLVDRLIIRDATKLTPGPGLLHALVRRARQGHRRRHDPPARGRGRRPGAPLDGGRPPVPLAAPERARPRRRGRATSASASPRWPSRGRWPARCSRRPPATRSPTCATSAAAGVDPGRRPGRRVADRLHRRPRLRAVDAGRPARSRPGTRSSPPASRTASARPGCSPSTWRDWRRA